MKIHLSSRSIGLLLIWLFITAINLDKAYHIDDPVHLETAQWILRAPLHPMSGKINWENDPEPIFLLNQPHLYFYLMAAWGKIWGFSEISMHLLQSLFSLACIILIHAIAKIIIPSRALFTTALLSLNPAFVVGQNMMVDVPLLSLWLAFFYVLVAPAIVSETYRFSLAGFIAGCACLTKYSSLSLIAVTIVYLTIGKQFKLLWTVGIPIAILILWSYFNYLDYGAIHILNRPVQKFSFTRIVEIFQAFLLCLGAILPCVFIYCHSLDDRYKSIARMVLASGLMLSIAIGVLGYFGTIDSSAISQTFAWLFFVNGSTIVLILAIIFVMNVGSIYPKKLEKILLLYLWISCGALFTIGFAPFMATRHPLLIIVPICLLLSYFLEKCSFLYLDIIILAVTAFLSLALGISDRVWASFYRDNAVAIRKELPTTANIYFTGHWGWQWYAKHNGMQQLAALHPQLKVGDYLVYPEGIHQQTLANVLPRFRLKLVKKYTQTASVLTFFTTRGNMASFYYSDADTSPWSLSWHQIPPIVVYLVEAK